jgi:hypothetical protein
MSQQECPVCFGNQWVFQTPCHHPICVECLVHLPKNECPSCRQELGSRLPPSLKGIAKMNSSQRAPSQALNIFSQEQFPSLS